MFDVELVNVSATLQNFNPRTEKIGTDRIPAADLEISCARDAGILAAFSPTLKHMLFDEGAPRDLAEGIQLRDKHMVYPLSRDEEIVGATVTIDFGIKSPMVFSDCKVNKFRLTPYDGGSVIVAFRVQCKPDEKQAGKLYTLQDQPITLTITPPTASEMAA